MAYDPDIIEAQWRPAELRPGRLPSSAWASRRTQGQPTHAGAPINAAPSAPCDFAESWPTLAAAMQRYRQNVAEEFIAEVRVRISAGIIRFDDRKRLAARAAKLEIRPFDAQLLIACAIRQWSIDQDYTTPVGRSERTWGLKGRSKWRQLILLIALSAILDAILIWQMNH